MTDLAELYSLDADALQARLLDHVGGSTWPPVHDAVALSRASHSGQQRKDATDYVEHPFRVALILVELCGLKDATLLCTALLHDVLEDTEADPNEIEEKFGARTLDMVKALTVPDPKAGQSKHEANMAYFKKLAWDPRDVQVVRSADRLDNLNTFDRAGFTDERRAEYLVETHDGLLELTLACNTALYHALKDKLTALGVTVTI